MTHHLVPSPSPRSLPARNRSVPLVRHSRLKPSSLSVAPSVMESRSPVKPKGKAKTTASARAELTTAVSHHSPGVRVGRARDVWTGDRVGGNKGFQRWWGKLRKTTNELLNSLFVALVALFLREVK